MAYCPNCGAPIEESAGFCGKCGASTAPSAGQENTTSKFAQPTEAQSAARDDGFDPADVEQNKVLALLAYIGPLFLVPLLAAPKSPYARFHTNQGIVLFIANVAVNIAVGIVSVILGAIIGFLGTLISLVGTLASLAFFVLAILGIVNAWTGKAKELPVIGTIKILK